MDAGNTLNFDISNTGITSAFLNHLIKKDILFIILLVELEQSLPILLHLTE